MSLYSRGCYRMRQPLKVFERSNGGNSCFPACCHHSNIMRNYSIAYKGTLVSDRMPTNAVSYVRDMHQTYSWIPSSIPRTCFCSPSCLTSDSGPLLTITVFVRLVTKTWNLPGKTVIFPLNVPVFYQPGLAVLLNRP